CSLSTGPKTLTTRYFPRALSTTWTLMLPDSLTFLLTNMRQRYNEAPKKPNFIFQVTDLQQEKIIIEKSGENR
ncbi:MAG: hypothetical protein IKT26_05975, partial [Bacteroidaceae bacterium]|nr:hypothetical protein [Bacteroidaceae bacterium]